jgi:23S rRNA pseudouridine2605 synthase
MEERLQKVLSFYGIASRRQAEQMILDGRIRVNGNTAHLGDKVLVGEDVIEVDGVSVKKEPERVYLMLHKPRGYVTTMHDEQGRKDVTSLVANCPQRVYPVGRLDLNSEGLLLFTNDGAAANRLMHPSGQVEKVYLAWVSGYYAGAEELLRQPMTLDGQQIQPAKITLKHSQAPLALLEVRIREGRNRQVRRMCEQVGLRVTRLKRIAEGNLQLGELPLGKWRYLSEGEIAYLKGL